MGENVDFVFWDFDVDVLDSWKYRSKVWTFSHGGFMGATESSHRIKLLGWFVVAISIIEDQDSSVDFFFILKRSTNKYPPEV